MSLPMHDGEASGAVDEQVRLHEHAKSTTNRGQPIDGALRAGRDAAKRRIARRGAAAGADIGARNIGLDPVDILPRLPIVAGLGAANGAVGIARPAEAGMHTAVQALPDRGVISPLVAHGT